MNFAKIFKKISRSLEFLSKVVTWIGAIALVIGLVSQFFEWGKGGPFRILKDNIQGIWLITLSATAVTLLVWMSRLHKRFVSGFSDNFTGDPHTNWDFVGPWRIPEENTLLVTGSDAGGITKVGAHWENYAFTFRARIVRDCLGVIVRAQDLNNYYMFQIQTDKIRPHRRAAYPVIDTSAKPTHEDLKNENVIIINRINFQIGWEVFDPPVPLNPPLNGEFDVKIIVRGESVFIYINGDLVLQQESFLKIATGKVGFRNDGHETALVRNVKVTLQT